jgi:hypothetical protein
MIVKTRKLTFYLNLIRWAREAIGRQADLFTWQEHIGAHKVKLLPPILDPRPLWNKTGGVE